MCDKNYTCRKNPQNKPHVESSFSNDDSSTSVNAKIPKQKTKNTIELYSSNDKLENETFVCEPCGSQMHHSQSCYPKTKDRVTFDNTTSQFPPSFNLHSAQKSTPKIKANNETSQGYFTLPSGLNTSSNATPTFKTTNTPLQTVVSIESNADQNQRADEIETIM